MQGTLQEVLQAIQKLMEMQLERASIVNITEQWKAIYDAIQAYLDQQEPG